MNKRTNLVTMKGNPVTLLGNEAKPGDKAPDFLVLTGDMQPYSLKDAGDKVKIISVVPSLDTGVCEAQTLRFNQEAKNLKDTIILTISVDLPFAQERFCSANSVENVVTLSDHKDLSFGLNYGFVMEENRLLSRGIVVVDRNNTIRYVEYVNEVTEHPDYDTALQEAAKII